MQESYSIFIQCGVGLEQDCVHEIQVKFPGVKIEEAPFGLKGYVSIRIESTPAARDAASLLAQELRCFEKLHVLAWSREVPWQSFNRRDRIEQKIADFFDDCFATMAKTGFLRTFSSITGKTQPPIKEVEITAPVPRFLQEYGLRQSHIQAIGKRKAREHGVAMILKQKGVTRLYVKILPGSILGLIQLQRPAGNFRLKSVHPTGLFPNFAFALIQECVMAYWEASVGTIASVHLVDPVCGAGTIPLLAWDQQAYLAELLGIEENDVNITGIEKEPAFFDKAMENAKALNVDAAVTLMNSDFLAADPEFKADIFIAQPPYGYSIAMDDDALFKLYEQLFSWCESHANRGAVFGMITPLTAWINEIAPQTRWKLARELIVKEHDVKCSMYIFQL
ncbi:MAG TPA: hypothetical protein VKM55_16350 [Candidatus Lokiarchaeia archaeon]|nr:hypothetical protein [Candidatus Lokiarchaeia archaeon]